MDRAAWQQRWRQEIGQRIRGRREQLELSAAEVARRMGRRGHVVISPGHQLERETGRATVRPWEIADYCRVLRCPAWWLLGMEPEEAEVLDETWSQQP